MAQKSISNLSNFTEFSEITKMLKEGRDMAYIAEHYHMDLTAKEFLDLELAKCDTWKKAKSNKILDLFLKQTKHSEVQKEKALVKLRSRSSLVAPGSSGRYYFFVGVFSSKTSSGFLKSITGILRVGNADFEVISLTIVLRYG